MKPVAVEWTFFVSRGDSPDGANQEFIDAMVEWVERDPWTVASKFQVRETTPEENEEFSFAFHGWDDT